MKRLLLIFVILLCLSGCSTHTLMETVIDDQGVGVELDVYYLSVSLPEGTAEPVMESGNGGKLFSCDGFWVITDVYNGGDIEHTFQQITGFEKDDLTVVTTKMDDFKKSYFAWTSLGEGKNQICKTVVLDDGSKHHAVTVICDFDLAGVLCDEMNALLNSATLIRKD